MLLLRVQSILYFSQGLWRLEFDDFMEVGAVPAKCGSFYGLFPIDKISEGCIWTPSILVLCVECYNAYHVRQG